MDSAEKRRKIGTAIAAAGILLMLAAAALTIFNLWDESRAEQAADVVLDEILDEMESGAGEQADDPSVGWSEGAEMPAVVLDGEDYVGILEIPSLSLALPVRDTWSYPNLRKTPCRYTGGLYSHDMVIAGHNYSSHFGRLNVLQVGDEVFFTDMDKNRCAYRVLETSTLSPTAIEEMTASGEWDLTLFTCTIGGRSRVTVRCIAQDTQDETAETTEMTETTWQE